MKIGFFYLGVEVSNFLFFAVKNRSTRIKSVISFIQFYTMAKIRVTKQFSFEMSHALLNYDGLCRNIHGHSYKLQVTLIGEPVINNENPKNGMVIDFGDLKKLINKNIVDQLDHSLMINAAAPHQNLLELGEMYERHHLVEFQPTTENLVVYFAEKVKEILPEHLELFSVRLYETSNSFAEWFASDNA